MVGWGKAGGGGGMHGKCAKESGFWSLVVFKQVFLLLDGCGEGGGGVTTLMMVHVQ